MSILQDLNTAVSVGYVVRIDDTSLGSFHTCEGLGCEVVMETREEGGNNTSVWQLPTRLRYSNIKLSRPLGHETELITRWFASMAAGYTLQTGTIVAMRSNATPVAAWGLLDVVPVRWTGPSFSADRPGVVTETIEIAHHGFLPGPF